MDFDVNKAQKNTLLLIFFNKKLSELLKFSINMTKIYYQPPSSVLQSNLTPSFTAILCPNPVSVSTS